MDYIKNKIEIGQSLPIRKKGKLERNTLGYMLLIPASLIILAISVYPFMYGIFLSFHDHNIGRPDDTSFIGLDNFVRLITTDTEFYGVLFFSFYYTTMLVLISYVTGLIYASLLNRDIKFRGLFRALILLPWVISPSVAANSWVWILNDHVGIINVTLRNLGVINESIQFLATPEMARLTVIFTSVWRSYPFMMIVILAGLQSIPKELYESAFIDGAGFFKSFFYITMPMIKGVSVIATTLMFIWTFNNFENIFLLTRGGPAHATFVLPILSYFTAFFRMQLGYASAISVLMLIVLLALAMVYLRVTRGQEVE